jgi:hypothetical protein
MDGGAPGMIGYGEDVIGFGVTGDAPGVLFRAAGDVSAHMLGIPVRFGVDHDIFKIKILAGIHDPDGDFATIGYENLSFQAVPRRV